MTSSTNWLHIQYEPLTPKPFKDTLKPQNNGPIYSNTVIGTLAVDGWAVTFGTARTGQAWVGCGLAQSHPRCTTCTSPLIICQCTNVILFDVAPQLPVPIKGLTAKRTVVGWVCEVDDSVEAGLTRPSWSILLGRRRRAKPTDELIAGVSSRLWRLRSSLRVICHSRTPHQSHLTITIRTWPPL